MEYFEPLRVSIAKISNLDSGLNINKTEPNRKVISEKKTRESILAHWSSTVTEISTALFVRFSLHVPLLCRENMSEH